MMRAVLRSSVSVLALGAGLALAAPAAAQTKGARASDAPNMIDEIIVTATKREERLQDVPLSVRAVTGEDLQRLNAQDLSGYINTVPGVSFENKGPGRSEISIRGLNSLGSPGSVEPVGYYIDDVAQTDEEQSDLELFDIRSVEILRGPQGTLYGEGSLGGTVKIATNAPDPSGLSYVLEGEYQGVKGGEGGHAIRGMLNVPLVDDRLALRIVGWDRDLPGWIDNTVLNQSDANGASVKGARVGLYWKATDDITVNLRAIKQKLDAGAPTQRNGLLGPDKVDIASDQYTRQDFDQVSAVVDWDLGFGTLSTIFARYHREQAANNFLGAFGGLDVIADQPVTTYSNETRFASKVGKHFDWIGGVYVMRRKDGVNQIATQLSDGSLFLSALGDATRRQAAVFGEVNYRPLSALQLTAGLRYFHEKNSFFNSQAIPGLGVPATLIDKETTSKALTPKFSARWKFSDDLQAYGLVSKGFRSGGNTYLSSAAGVPDSFDPDYAWNYEAGVKSQWLNRRLTLNAAVYRIAWKNIQTLAEAAALPGLVTTTNAGAAHSQGLEIEARAVPVTGLTLTAGLGLIDAEFDDPAPALGIAPGDKLPGVARSTFSMTADYEFPLSGELRGYLGGNVRRVGKSLSNYGTDGVAPPGLKSYVLVGLQAGIDSEAWSLRLFADNLFDKEVITGFEDFNGDTRLDYVNRPRTVGLRLTLRR